MANRGQKPNYSPLKKKGGGGVEQAKERGVFIQTVYTTHLKKKENHARFMNVIHARSLRRLMAFTLYIVADNKIYIV